MTSMAIRKWCQETQVEWRYIAPGIEGRMRPDWIPKSLPKRRKLGPRSEPVPRAATALRPGPALDRQGGHAKLATA